MGILILISVIAFPLIFYSYWRSHPQSQIRLIRIIYIINTYSLLTCSAFYFMDKFQLNDSLQKILCVGYILYS